MWVDQQANLFLSRKRLRCIEIENLENELKEIKVRTNKDKDNKFEESVKDSFDKQTEVDKDENNSKSETAVNKPNEVQLVPDIMFNCE